MEYWVVIFHNAELTDWDVSGLDHGNDIITTMGPPNKEASIMSLCRVLRVQEPCQESGATPTLLDAVSNSRKPTVSH